MRWFSLIHPHLLAFAQIDLVFPETFFEYAKVEVLGPFFFHVSMNWRSARVGWLERSAEVLRPPMQRFIRAAHVDTHVGLTLINNLINVSERHLER